MSRHEYLNNLNKVFIPFEEMTKLAIQGTPSISQEFNRFSPIELTDLIASLDGISIKSFLTKRALAQRLSELHEQSGRLRLYIPEGVRVTLAALPCDLSGFEIPADQLNDNRISRQKTDGKAFPYLYILLSDPKDPQSLTSNLHGGTEAPYLKILPKELIEQCSFVVNYKPLLAENSKSPQQQDFESIAYPLIFYYDRLQKLYFPGKK